MTLPDRKATAVIVMQVNFRVLGDVVVGEVVFVPGSLCVGSSYC